MKKGRGGRDPYGYNSIQGPDDELPLVGILELVSLDVVRHVRAQLIEVNHFEELVEGNQLQVGNTIVTDSWRWGPIGQGPLRVQLDFPELLRARIGHAIWQLGGITTSTKQITTSEACRGRRNERGCTQNGDCGGKKKTAWLLNRSADFRLGKREESHEEVLTCIRKRRSKSWNLFNASKRDVKQCCKVEG